MVFAVEEAPPAGGAALDEVLIAAVIFTAAYLPLAWFLLRERGGHTTVLGRLADWLSVRDHLPRWAGLPVYLSVASLFLAGFGVYWDVPIHMQYGRDEGPLANPSHYPILFGIIGFTAAGVISAGLAKDPLPRRTVRLARGWHVPMGAMVLLGAGAIASVGFPADDLWHRLFGQDVTEWGPTHVMMIGGAVTCIMAVPLLFAEARQVGGEPLGRPVQRLFGWIAKVCFRVAGAVLPPVRREVADIGVDTQEWGRRVIHTIAISGCIIPFAFLMEFDLGVPQFPVATLFIISGFLTGWIFTAARAFFGPGGALVAWSTYVILRLAILLMTLPIPTIHHARWMLFLGVAVVIEFVAFAIRTRGPLFGAVAGGLGGGLGLAVDLWWIGAFMPAPLPVGLDHAWWLLPLGAVAGAGGGLLGPVWARLITRIADPDPAPARPGPAGASRRKWAGTVGVAVFVGLMAFFAPPTGHGEVDVVKACEGDACTTTYVPVEGSDVLMGTVDYETPCIGEEQCRSHVTVQVTPADAADDALWISSIAYQGFHADDEVYPTGQLTTDLEPTGTPGEFRTEDPLPLYGEWKAFLRLHRAPTEMLALPLHLPEDPAIESNASGLVETADGTTLPWVHEPMMLQREREEGVPLWLWSVAYALVIGAWLVLLAFYGWCFVTAAGGGSARAGGDRDARQSA